MSRTVPNVAAFLSVRILVAFFLMTMTVNAQTVAQLFTVDATCNGIDLDTYLNDARTMLASAQTGVSNLQNTRSFITSTTRHYMRNAANAFGTSYYKASTISGITSADKATLSGVSTNLGAAQSLLSLNVAGPNSAQLGPTRAYISCSDASYVTTSNAHDIDPSIPDGTGTQEAFAVPSLYYVPESGNTGVQRTIIRPNPNLPGTICQPGVVALTQTQNAFTPDQPLVQMVLCPPFFNSANYQQSITPTTAPAATDYLGAFQFAASVFIHELYHIFGNTFNDVRYYVNSDSSATFYDPYGPGVIYALANQPSQFTAQYGAINTLELPDAYRIFCDMCQFPQTKWYSYIVQVTTQALRFRR